MIFLSAVLSVPYIAVHLRIAHTCIYSSAICVDDGTINQIAYRSNSLLFRFLGCHATKSLSSLRPCVVIRLFLLRYVVVFRRRKNTWSGFGDFSCRGRLHPGVEV